MSLQERQRLLRNYRAAVQAYHEAAASFDESAFHDSLHRTERARNQAETARADLLRHEHLHAGAIGSKAKASEPVIIGSTVALFNIDTEHWDLFELAVCGPPPSGALAFAPDSSLWISDPQEMNTRQSRNTRLFYTEAGLGLLREAGLEM